MVDRVVLASASSARARLLRDAGIAFTIDPADLDEGHIKTEQHALGATALSCAAELARAKAQAVAMRNRDALVIGADQILALDDAWFDKPPDIAAAREQLVRLRGRTHRLATAVCACRNGEPVWQASSEPRLTMRRFSDRFLDDYLAAEGEAMLGSVGAYRLEGRGVQLFTVVEGDHFAIQGLPLVALLVWLRDAGALPA
ncbi:MAG: Maf family protein [Stellaceae bacterium]